MRADRPPSSYATGWTFGLGSAPTLRRNAVSSLDQANCFWRPTLPCERASTLFGLPLESVRLTLFVSHGIRSLLDHLRTVQAHSRSPVGSRILSAAARNYSPCHYWITPRRLLTFVRAGSLLATRGSLRSACSEISLDSPSSAAKKRNVW